MENAGAEFIPVDWKRKHARHAGPVERQRVSGQTRHGIFLEIIVEKTLDALVGGANVSRQQPFLLAILRDEGRRQFAKLAAVRGQGGLVAHQSELEINVRDQWVG